MIYKTRDQLKKRNARRYHLDGGDIRVMDEANLKKAKLIDDLIYTSSISPDKASAGSCLLAHSPFGCRTGNHIRFHPTAFMRQWDVVK